MVSYSNYVTELYYLSPLNGYMNLIASSATNNLDVVQSDRNKKQNIQNIIFFLLYFSYNIELCIYIVKLKREHIELSRF